MRNAKVNIIDDGVVSVEPILSDESQKIVNDNETKKQPEEDITNKLKKILEGDNSDNLEIVLEEIDNIKSLIHNIKVPTHLGKRRFLHPLKRILQVHCLCICPIDFNNREYELVRLI